MFYEFSICIQQAKLNSIARLLMLRGCNSIYDSKVLLTLLFIGWKVFRTISDEIFLSKSTYD